MLHLAPTTLPRLHRVLPRRVKMATCSEDGVSDGLVERFLDEVKKYPCVYDTRKLEYRGALKKDSAWEAIRAERSLATSKQSSEAPFACIPCTGFVANAMSVCLVV